MSKAYGVRPSSFLPQASGLAELLFDLHCFATGAKEEERLQRMAELKERARRGYR